MKTEGGPRTPKARWEVTSALLLTREVLSKCQENDHAGAIVTYKAAKAAPRCGAFQPEPRLCSSLLALCGSTMGGGTVDLDNEAEQGAGQITQSVGINSPERAVRSRRDAAFEIFGDLVLTSQDQVEATFTMLIRACVADDALDAAEAVLASVQQRKIKLKLRTYSTLLRAHCWHGRLGRALKLASECVEAGMALGEAEHCALVVCRGRGLRGDAGFEEAGALIDPRAAAPLDALSHDCLLPSQAAWDAVETYMGALEPIWAMSRNAEVSAAGICSTCSARLRSVDLIPVDRALLLRQIEGLVPRAESHSDDMSLFADADGLARNRSAQWSTYTRWLQDRDAPYDCVIDGANVGFHRGTHGNVLSHIDFRQIDSVIRHCVDLGRRCLVVLHRRHLADDRLPSSARPVVHAWRRAKILYSCSLQNNDDWYWLYAAVRGGAGTLLVSNDEMRDHHFGMLSAHAFLVWKERHLTKFDLHPKGLDNSCKVVLCVPPPFSVRIQHNSTANPESWHFPAPSQSPFEVKRPQKTCTVVQRPELTDITWLCCTQKFY